MSKVTWRDRPKRDSEAVAFARQQHASANEFALEVWQMVRNRRCRGQKFRREYPIPPYTVDFCCVALKLIIEIDGEHYQTEAGQAHDARRDSWLAKHGYEVLRIPGFRATQDPDEVKFRSEFARTRLVICAVDTAFIEFCRRQLPWPRLG